MKYKEIVSSLQQQLEYSKQRVQQFKVCVCTPLLFSDYFQSTT